MDLFNDRRQQSHLPKEEDYSVLLTKATLTEANRRFRQFGVPRVVGTDKEKAAKIVHTAMKQRRKGVVSPQTVGEYLEFLNGMED